MTNNETTFKLVLCQLFELPDATAADDTCYKVLYKHLMNLINEIDQKASNYEDTLLNLAAMRVLGPVYELSRMDTVRTYRNEDRVSMRFEIARALEDFAARGIFNDTHISKALIRDMGITMHEGMWDLI